MPRDAARGEPSAAMVQEHGGLVAHHGPLGQVALQRLGGLAGHGHLALLAALAAHAQPALGAVQVFQVQPRQLADAHAAAVEQLEDGAVARRDAAAPACPPRTPSISALTCSGVITSGSFLGRFGRAHQARHVDRDHALAQQEAEQAADRRQLAPDGHGGELVAVERRQPFAQHQQVDGRAARAVRFRAAKGSRETGADRPHRRPRVWEELPPRARSSQVSVDLRGQLRHRRCHPFLQRRQRAAADLGVARRLVAAQAEPGRLRRAAAAGRR